jgi:aarF domain-containing kinase
LSAQSNGDIKLIEILIDVGEYLFPEFRYKWFAEELREHIPKELNFKLEVENMKKATKYL